MSTTAVLFLVTLLLLVFLVGAAWKASRRSEEKIAALEEKLAVYENDGGAGAGAPGEPGGDALERISAYLRHAVASPLQEGLEGGDEELRVRADDALAAVEDMEFFADDRHIDLQPQSLHAAIEEVTDEYTDEFDVMVKWRDADPSLRARVDSESFKDAIYLVLVNAGHFGRGNPVEVTLESAGEFASLRVRDHGPGFSEEALRRAAEPFYTTEEGALGLGLAHAARILRDHGGEVLLGNSPRGGGEVEIRLPKI